MDDFDIETLDKYIKKYKRNIIFKLENINMTEKDLRNMSDNLCMVLEFSPRVQEERKLMGKKNKKSIILKILKHKIIEISI
jgi:hypothetical protein